MKFQRSVFQKNECREVTPRRLAAAKRAVQRDADAVALFPELRRETTAEARLKAMDEGFAENAREWRDHRANAWRLARRRLAGMRESQRAGILRYWAQFWTGPKDPAYLASMITNAERGECFWHRCAELRRLALVGQGKLPWSFVAKKISP